jgi:hypothetical protein
MQEVLRDVSEMHDAEQRLAQLVVLRYNQATRKLLVHNVTPSKIASNFNLMLDETLMLVDDDDVVHMIHPKLDIFEPEPEPGKKFVVEGTIRQEKRHVVFITCIWHKFGCATGHFYHVKNHFISRKIGDAIQMTIDKNCSYEFV